MPMSALLATSPDATSPEGRLLNAMLACPGVLERAAILALQDSILIGPSYQAILRRAQKLIMEGKEVCRATLELDASAEEADLIAKAANTRRTGHERQALDAITAVRRRWVAYTGTEPASSYYWRSLLCAGQESQKEIAVCL